MLNRWLFQRHVEEDEDIVRIVHKHWLLGLRSLFWPTVIAAVCIVLLAIARTRPQVLLFAGASILAVVWWLRSFFDYFLDAWIVTSTGVIDVAWHGWFHRESARVLYSDIQGVSYEICGVWGTILRYGTVSIEKISTGAAISLEYVPRPRRVEADILRCMETYSHQRNMKNAKHVQDILAEMVAARVQAEDFATDDEEEDDDLDDSDAAE